MKVEIPCLCFKAVPFEYEEEIDLEKNPEIADQILSGNFMTVKCPKCGKILKPEFPFHIKDEKKDIDIFFIPEMQRDNYLRGKAFQFKNPGRIVIGFLELAEKLRIINEKLDDQVIEGIKYYMVSKIEADSKPEDEIRTYFDRITEEGELLFQIHGLKKDKIGLIKIPKNFYDTVRVKLLAYKKTEPFSLFLTPPYVSILRVYREYEEHLPSAEEKKEG